MPIDNIIINHMTISDTGGIHDTHIPSFFIHAHFKLTFIRFPKNNDIGSALKDF